MLSMGNDVISYHGGGILKLGCKKPSSEKTVSRFKVDIEAYRNGEPSCRGQMRSQRGMVRGFVMTETGIPGIPHDKIFHIMSPRHGAAGGGKLRKNPA